MNVDMKANREWASRPDDQRFLSLEELYTKTKERAERHSQIRDVDWYVTR